MIQAATQPAPRTSHLQRPARKSQRFSLQEHSIRSDERSQWEEQRLHREIVTSFKSSGHSQLWKVAVRVQGDQVSLQGQVSTYYLKQLAQTFVLKLAGVKRLENELVVA